MRVTFVVPVLDMSGGARIIAGHARRLQEKGHEVTIVAPMPAIPRFMAKIKSILKFDRDGEGANKSHYHVADVPIRLGELAGLIQDCDVPDADFVIATWWETAEWASTFSPRKGRKVHFIQAYEVFPGQPKERVDATWRLPFIKIAVSEWLVALGRDQFGVADISLVLNSVDHDIFHVRSERPVGQKTVGFLYHPAESKDMWTHRKALELLRERSPNTRIICFGAKAPRAGDLPSATEFYLLPSQEQIAEIYSRCTVWLSASRTEGYNLTALEAMACGCPTVCARTGRPAEVIKQGVNGYLVEQGDAAGFAEALHNVVTLAPADWKTMSGTAVKAASRPTWEESNGLFGQILIENKGGSGQPLEL